MSTRRERPWVWAIAILALLLISLPYLYAWRAADAEHVFGGFLLNPLDGNSYLAKMRQGWEGAWSFTLPYTAKPGEGGALNLFYLFLGHIARWTGLSLLVTFHAARLLGAGLLLAMLYRFLGAILEDGRSRLAAFALAALGSGLGWLALAFGAFTPDFWLAEAYPFLAAYANPHFPLGMALQLWLLMPLASQPAPAWRWLLYALGSALLALIYPFGLAVAGAVLAVQLVLRFLRGQPFVTDLARVVAVGLGALPYAGYVAATITGHPQLALWNAQNLTPAPDLAGLLVALSPALLMALFGAYVALRRDQAKAQLLLIWLLVGLALIYLPFSLQRRLSSGLYIPIAGLAILGIEHLTRNWRRWAWLAPALILLALPTNWVILAGGAAAAAANNPDLYLYADEAAAFEWLAGNAEQGELVLAGPQTGLYLPAYSDARVLYGHPFETVNAETQRLQVLAFFGRELDEEWLAASGVDFIFYGPREQAFGPLPSLPNWHPVYQQGAVQIWGPLD